METMTETTSKSSTVLINSSEVANLLGVGKRRLFLFFKTDLSANFPKPVQLGKRVNRWVRSEVEQWVVNEMPRFENIAAIKEEGAQYLLVGGAWQRVNQEATE
jgi:predicted DNA-binding transcriptional regulator AlpA